jgi:hypothetical protein
MSDKLVSRIRTNQAYRLNWNIDHLGTGEVEFDAWLVNYPNHPGSWHSYTEQFDLPNPVEFEAIGSLLTETDYPYTDVGWPVMSKRMLDVILSVGSFPHRIYPVVMINTEAAYNYKLKKVAFPRTKNHDYIMVQLTEHLDAFDFENSIYKRGSINPNVITSIEWLSLIEPESEFPPLFTVEPASMRLLISTQARSALEAANIQGVRFTHIEDETIA